MTRPSFTTTIAGAYTKSINSGAPVSVAVSDSKYAREIVVGTSRRKPQGWIPPTSYSLRRTVYRRAEGKIILPAEGLMVVLSKPINISVWSEEAREAVVASTPSTKPICRWGFLHRGSTLVLLRLESR